MTLGPALIFLALVDRNTPKILKPALTIGKVPLFYYVLHFMLVHPIRRNYELCIKWFCALVV